MKMPETDELLCAISQVISLRQDIIHEFTLFIREVDFFSGNGDPYRELDQIIHHLSRNHTVKKLELEFDAFGISFYNLPFSIFSLHHLTELCLSWCGLDHQPVFNGFGSLTSLTLYCVRIPRKTLLHLLSRSPSLKSFTLLMDENHIVGHEKSTMIELFECLPMIEHLTICSQISPWFVPDLVPQELPNPQIHLKFFCFTRMSFHDGYGLTFLAVLIKSSPNLEKIELKIDPEHDICDLIDDPEIYEQYHSYVWLDHLSDLWLEHPNEMKIEYFSNLEPEMEFVKFILARSPKLKKVSITSWVTIRRDKEQDSMMLKTLLRAPRVSAVEINCSSVIIEGFKKLDVTNVMQVCELENHVKKSGFWKYQCWYRCTVGINLVINVVVTGIFTASVDHRLVSIQQKHPEMKAKRLSKAKRVQKAKRLSETQRLSLDMITTLPQPIIETILCLLPIEEAARTSILSREWRYKWTKIPKLVFSLPYESKTMEINKLFCAIHQVMSLRQDPIHEFTLCLDATLFSQSGYVSCELDQIILQLSRNHAVKKLTLEIEDSCRFAYDLPLSFFSLHHLTELNLGLCRLEHQPTFNGFGSLTSLTLGDVMISIKTLLHLLSSCPSLKSFGLVSWSSLLILLGFRNSSEYSKLLQLMIAEYFIGDEKSTMIELFKCLPLIEHLTILNDIIKWFVPDLVPQELPTSLIHLKYFCFERMSFYDVYGLTFLAVVIKNSPNLEKIELEIDDNLNQCLCEEMEFDSDKEEECHSTVWLKHLSDVWLEHLIELKFKRLSNLEPEMEFVKFILARSPKLKKVHIRSKVQKDQESRMLKTLLRAPRASRVEIDVV
ncbi:hypothetical protein M8C21_011362 [Ambrosia artemisiifolia]|uniref:FBD domain-containing protein n=1 Tax=Ambrosia artemisiifolia TaxID=4212 RepID=A0AAD5C0X9_AMBAR|nr:hypothetical protein M8C21_011362 [Ambrosia artemisiifolia]